MSNTILSLWQEKHLNDLALKQDHCEHHVLASKEYDSIANAILSLSPLTEEEFKAILWAKKRLGK